MSGAPETKVDEINAEGTLALALGGGGARAAYQAGFLQAIGRRFPFVQIPIMTGVSAGAINTAFLANHPANFASRTEHLCELWSQLRTNLVFDASSMSLGSTALRWGMRLISGGSRVAPRPHGMVDTTPLRHFLMKHLQGAEDGSLPGIVENLDAGRLRAAAITTTNYATSKSVTWVQGRDVPMWNRPMRTSVATRLRIDHVMASSALPLFFPAVNVNDEWHGDGGIRLTAPLSPALHLGATRILAISTRFQRVHEEPLSAATRAYPAPAHVLGVLMSAIFIDNFDHDAMNLDRLNKLIEAAPEDSRMGLRPVELLIVRPTRDLAKIAGEHEINLPRSFRFMMRGLGTKESKTPDSLSMVLFEPEYINPLIELGRSDAEARMADIEAFLGGEEVEGLQRTGFWRL
jgi:NTE family protein